MQPQHSSDVAPFVSQQTELPGAELGWQLSGGKGARFWLADKLQLSGCLWPKAFAEGSV